MDTGPTRGNARSAAHSLTRSRTATGALARSNGVATQVLVIFTVAV